MMKKNLLILIALLSILSAFLVFKINKKTMIDEENLAVYVNNQLVSTIPKKGEAIYIKSVCDTDAKASWNNDSWSLFINNLNQKTKCNLYFYSGQTVFDFDYTGGEQNFIAPVSGTYRLETWGAQGGSSYLTVGGYGGYSKGMIFLDKDQKIYVNVGGTTTSINGGYNGGGNGNTTNVGDVNLYLGGGGATNIATKTGILSELENYKTNILIVSGGGGGIYHFSDYYIANGGAAGGYIGNNDFIFLSECANKEDKAATGGTQTNAGLGNNADKYYGGSFGKGGNGLTGGGAGYYGGGGTYNVGCSAEGGGGGSGYIGNSLLNEKMMYCYNCQESSEESTKTISTTCNEETPTENCAKKGNGYARITLVSIDE